MASTSSSDSTSPQLAIDRWPARLDWLQSISGLLLVLFLWCHMFLVSSILLGKDAMYTVARWFEGVPLFGKPYPIIVAFIAAVVIGLVVIHALLALRKLPANYRQYQAFKRHRIALKHSDTNWWFIQAITGFALFFLAIVHLYTMLTHPADIGPYASSDRVWSGMMWPLYLVLLFVVEIHGGVGLYRLLLKWGWWQSGQWQRVRKRLQWIKWGLTSFFIILGLCTLAAYIKIGIEHSDNAGERYIPTILQQVI